MKIKQNLKQKLLEYWRVLKATKKPDSIEFKTIVKITGLGIGIIGLMGFLISMIKQIFF